MENIKASFRFNSLAHLTGTIRVYPREIEEVMYQIPQILEVTVIGVPHERRLWPEKRPV